jgi:hypothetical protein
VVDSDVKAFAIGAEETVEAGLMRHECGYSSRGMVSAQVITQSIDPWAWRGAE